MKNFISRGLMLVIMIMIGLISLNKIHGQTTVEIPEITITGNQNEALKYNRLFA